MQFGELLPEPAHFGLHFGDRGFSKHGVREGHHLVVGRKAAIYKITQTLLLEETADRAVRAPVKIAGDVQADAVAG